MTDQRGRPSQAAAYRARPVPPNPHQAFRVRRGPALAAGMVPVPPPPTDSAAAPRLPRGRQKPLVSVPADPAYEKKLEQLAEAMLGQAGEAAAREAAPDALAAPGAASKMASTPSAANGGPAGEAASGAAGLVQPGAGTATEREMQREPGPRPERPREPAPDHSPLHQRRSGHNPQPQAQREVPPEAQPLRRRKHAGAADQAQAPRRRPAEAERREPLLTPLAEEQAGLVAQREAGPALPRKSRQSASRSGLAVSLISMGLVLALGGAWWLAQGEAGRQSFMSSGGSAGMERQDSSDGGDRTSAPVAGGVTAPRPEAGNDTRPDITSAGRAPSTSSADNSQARVSPQPESTSMPSPVSPASAPREARTERPGETAREAASRGPEDLPSPTADAQAQQSAPKAVSAPAVGAIDARRAGKGTSGKSTRAGPGETRKASRQTTDRESRTAARGTAAKRQAKAAAPSPPRDDEIDRLKSQAYGESSRDRSRRGAPPAAPRPSPASAPSSMTPVNSTAEEPRRVGMQKELARCEKLQGLFYQERCKWRLCSDQWGRNGCPSYPKNEALQ